MARADSALRAGVVGASVLALALAVRLLAPGARPATPEPGVYTVSVHQDTAGSAPGESHLQITALIVDGRLARAESLGDRDDWRVIDSPAEELPSKLQYVGPVGGAALTFHGRRFVMVVDAEGWSGQLRVERNGQRVAAQTFSLRSAHTPGVVLEYPGTSSSLLLFFFGAALAIFTALARWCMSLRRERSTWAWAVVYLIALHLVFWASQCIGVTGDSAGYLGSVGDLRSGEASYFPPGYPALFAVVGRLSADGLGGWMALLQHAMAVIVSLWTLSLLRRVVPDSLALLGAVTVGSLDVVLGMSQTVMSEVPTMFAMAGALYYATCAEETGHWRPAVGSGLLLGWAATLRVVPVAALVPAIAVCFLPATSKNLRLAGAIVVTAALVVLTPMTWFWYHTGSPALATSTGLHLFDRVVTEQHALDRRGPATQELIRRLQPDSPLDMAHWTIREHAGMKDLDYRDAERLLGRVAVEGIRAAPWDYAVLTLKLASRELLTPAPDVPWAAMPEVAPRLETPPPVPFTATGLHWRWDLRTISSRLWPFLCAAAAAGVLLGLRHPRRRLVAAIAWVPVGYLLSTASLDLFQSRHSMPGVPFVVMLAMVCCHALLVAGLKAFGLFRGKI
jgi:4-amino-4-deoxy-L-arabinose transferase-like glycosyltransferase